MTAIVQDGYGAAPETVLRLDQAARPQVADDRVLVRVRAASVDRGTVHLMTGLPYLGRAFMGLRRPKALNPGRCLSGIVEAVGASVTAFRPGDEVYGSSAGSFAEFASARADLLAPKPANLSFEEAAAAPISGVTALQAVRDRAKIEPGQRVLIVGASGGVGTYAVQLAKAFGAEVTGVCSTGKVDLVRSLGADHVIDYTRDDVTGAGRAYDAILDIGGNRPVSQLRRVLTPKGRLVIVGGETDGRWLGGLDRQLRAHLLSPWVSQTLGTFVASASSADLTVLRDLLESGKVTSAVDRTYPLREVPLAMRYVAEGRARGKVAITVSDRA
ncbi:MAG TPA: NAD(P)-dependent alcohol dehydrogenase [Candidatus Lustribacter sp.]|nr:NAD(P)-dependent alcohol dehydrogenase [Candidatus Lustribacter sp.]